MNAMGNSLQKGGLRKRMWQHRYIYLMMLPGLLFLLIFLFFSIGGSVLAFKDYKLNKTFFMNMSYIIITIMALVLNL